MSSIREIRFWKIIRPLRTVFATSLGRKSQATSVLVRVTLADGHSGLGEIPTSFVLPHETVGAIGTVLGEARNALRGVEIMDSPDIHGRLRSRHGQFHMTLAGLEVALLRAALAAEGMPELHWFWRFLAKTGSEKGTFNFSSFAAGTNRQGCKSSSKVPPGGGKKSRTSPFPPIETDITVPFIPEGNLLERWLGRVARTGFGTYKVKVSGDVDADMAFVLRAREWLARRVPDADIRLDGNQGYTARTYLKMLGRLEKAKVKIELFEQPLRKDDYRGFKEIRSRSPVPVILDETCFCEADCRRIVEDRLGHGVNVKLAKSGIDQSQRIMRLARAAGLKLMIGCMTETMVGLSAGIHLAAGTGAFDYIDLDSIHLMAHGRRYGDIGLTGPRYVMEDGGCSPTR